MLYFVQDLCNCKRRNLQVAARRRKNNGSRVTESIGLDHGKARKDNRWDVCGRIIDAGVRVEQGEFVRRVERDRRSVTTNWLRFYLIFLSFLPSIIL